MRRVIAIRHVEDCFDGDFIKEFELDAPLDAAVMHRLAEDAVLEYHPEFPRPYFRIDKRGRYTIQGVIGKTTFRVTFSRSTSEEAIHALISRIQKGETDGCETDGLLRVGQEKRGAADSDAAGDEDAHAR